METILSLLERSAIARSKSDWNELEQISIQILRAIFKDDQTDEKTLRNVIQNYLSSIIGTGKFLTDLKSLEISSYQAGLNKLFEFLGKGPHQFSSIETMLHAAQEIALLALNPINANRNKIGKHLREIARPDLSIIICNQILEQTRLNYYSLTVLCGAYCDLNEFDFAIEVADLALKHSPDDGKTYPLNALVRAHTLKFKATGDISEIEKALEYGHTSIDLKLDSYAANAFVAAAVASGDEREIDFAKETLAKAEPQLREVDISALFQTYQAAQALAPGTVVVETIDESIDHEYSKIFDSLFDLVVRDEGFSPTVSDLRNMKERFASGGWFLQGLCHVPCPNCEVIALHSYRKHFMRYGKGMHYWAIVCDNCKTATDSIDIDKNVFSFISGDLEDNFPVSLLCSECP